MSGNPLIHCFSLRPSVVLWAQFCSYKLDFVARPECRPSHRNGNGTERNDDRTRTQGQRSTL